MKFNKINTKKFITVLAISSMLTTLSGCDKTEDNEPFVDDNSEITDVIEPEDLFAEDPIDEITTPEPEPVDISTLQVPDVHEIFRTNFEQVSEEDLLQMVAIPNGDYAIGYDQPNGTPSLLLGKYTNIDQNKQEAAWTVVGNKGITWVRVMIPAGRGSLASQNPENVNHHAVWIRTADVTLHRLTKKLTIDINKATMTIERYGSVQKVIPVGVGKENSTPSPKGLCSVSAKTLNQADAPTLVLSCQSTAIDNFQNSGWSVTAIHVGRGEGQVSNGCIRVDDDLFSKYLDTVPIGTPVVIQY